MTLIQCWNEIYKRWIKFKNECLEKKIEKGCDQSESNQPNVFIGEIFVQIPIHFMH